MGANFCCFAFRQTEKRTGWVNQKVKQPESVADHMYRMAMMALVLPESDGPPLNIARCAPPSFGRG